MRTLLPVLKERKRYVVYEIVSEAEIDFAKFKNTAWDLFLSFLGELGSSRAGLMFVPDVCDVKKGVIRVAHDHVNELKTVLGLLRAVGDDGIIVNVVRTAGTIRKAKKILSEY